ncbi:MAG: NAD(P)-dependent oxidoreductase [Anaerolineales bacterium]
MTSPLRVHLLDKPAAGALQTLQSRLDAGIVLTFGANLPVQAETQILVAGRPERAHLESSPALERLIIPFAGLPPATRALLLDFPHIKVHNLHHNAALTAEMALALLLAAAKFIIPYDRALRAHDWTPRYQPNPSILLEGKTALVLGFGAIGKRIARACWGLGMRVHAIRRNPRQETPEFPVSLHPSEALANLLPHIHALLIALPATPQTDGLLRARELALLPEGSLLVNIGRAAIVEQQALFEALHSGKLAAAGLDVWYNYPVSPESRAHTPSADLPFHELDNLVMSPHRGGHSSETESLRMSALADLLNAAARGQPVPNPVDVAAGY